MKTIPHISPVAGTGAVEYCTPSFRKHGGMAAFICLAVILLAGPFGLGTRAFGDAVWGNTFNTGNTSGSLAVTNANSIWTTFTADSAFQVSSIWINSNNAMAAGTSMNVELYAVDTVTGKPTGTALASQTVSGIGAGWHQFTGFSHTLT